MLTNVATLNINRFEFVNVIISSGNDDDDGGGSDDDNGSSSGSSDDAIIHSNEMLNSSFERITFAFDKLFSVSAPDTVISLTIFSAFCCGRFVVKTMPSLENSNKTKRSDYQWRKKV